MQKLFYDEAPYHILYYDSELHAYRTDKFAGWKNQPPERARRCSASGYSGYMLLTDATAVPPPAAAPESPSAGAGPAPARRARRPARPRGDAGTSGTRAAPTPLLIGGVLAVAWSSWSAGSCPRGGRRAANVEDE